MAHRRSSASTTSSTSSNNKTTTLRRSTSTRGSTRAQATPPPSDSRGRHVLGTLHTNPTLRRHPSTRMRTASGESVGPNARVGEKRKRVPSVNENFSNSSSGSAGRPTQRLKREHSVVSEEDESDLSEADDAAMDVDSSIAPEDEDDEDNSTDAYLLGTVPAATLERERKDNLIRLCQLADIDQDADFNKLTKGELVRAILEAREELVELPPSSPPRGGDADGPNSSDCSSDDGHPLGEEEDGEDTDVGGGRSRAIFNLRRRATVNDMDSFASRPNKGRSLSMGNVLQHQSKRATRYSGEPVKNGEGSSSSSATSTRKSSRRSSPTESNSAASAFPSPPVTRLRSTRRGSNESLDSSSTTSSSFFTNTSARTVKGKGRQVEIDSTPIVIEIETPSGAPRMAAHPEESDGELTEIEDLEAQMYGAGMGTPSPRRTRSKGPGDSTAAAGPLLDLGRRVTPARKAKCRIGSFKEEDSEEEEDDMLDEGEAEEEEEMASASTTPTRKTPRRNRLRPRVQTHTPPSDGDDENEGGEDELEESGAEEVAELATLAEEDEGEDEATVVVQPRKLRNGKVVGEDGAIEDIPEEEDEGEAEDDDIDVDAEADEDAFMEEVDLTAATVKSLQKLLRPDLVRLCETRDLDVAGNKMRLAKSLLQWRDRQGTDFSSPSSTGTIRPPSTKRPRRKGQSSGTTAQPVLMREKEDRFHMDEPRTPPMSSHRKETEPELELDLESLGLNDREIPPEKITKLEKIGSGGFKDVFIGKYQRKRIAISEFRGHLTAMDIKELKLLGGFNHPNIVRFIGVSIPENTRDTPVMIISELCQNGDLFDYVRNVPAPSAHKVFSIMLDVACGLKYLHDCTPSIIHRDCKSSNILITTKCVAKIADFGLAKVKQSTRSMVRSLVGTVNWQAPELWSAHPEYNHKVDVFSCAMVYWEMLQWHLKDKKFPWEGMNEHAIYDIVGAKKQRPSLTGLRKQWGTDAVDLMVRMWAHNHEDRPTISEVVDQLTAIIAKTPKAPRSA